MKAYTNIKIFSSCEIEIFVVTHLCKLCVILRSRVLRVVCLYSGYTSVTPLCNYSVAIRVKRLTLVSLCAETIKNPVFEGNKI